VSTGRDLLLGVDAGGTKIHAVIEDRDGRVVDERIIADAGWGDSSFVRRAELIAKLAEPFGGAIASVGVGAHGCDSDPECADLRSLVESRLAPVVPVSVVNDAELLGHAHGAPQAINVVLGTGSIVVSRTADGAAAYLGGWGWLVGDDGSAWGLVRSAVRHLTLEVPDLGLEDPLVAKLVARTGVRTLRDLVDAMQQGSPAGWAGWADVVFAAAQNGSSAAESALENGIAHTLDLIGQALAHNPSAPAVVLGGGVIAHQPTYAERIRASISDRFDVPSAVVSLAPVRGAVALARAGIHHAVAPSAP